MTLRIKGYFMTFSMNDTGHKLHSAKQNSAIMLSVVTLYVVAPDI